MRRAADYEKEEKLGAGGFGVVYRVRSNRSGNIYAMKEQQLTSYGKDALFANNANYAVENEVEVLRKMSPHANVIAYHGAWKEFGIAYILMEYAETGSLDNIMKKRGKPFSEKTSLFVFAQLMAGVNHIHRESIIHRDLKPANVMVDRVRNSDGKYMQIVKIGDFGIAKDTAVSIARTAIGTRIYMAPETLTGSRYDSRCDMWSCGIILYELLTNRYPFEADNPREMMTNIKDGRVNPFPIQAITEDVKRITYKLLSVNPTERLRSRDIVVLPEIDSFNKMVREHLNPSSHYTLGSSMLRTCDTYGEMARGLARTPLKRPIVIKKLNLLRKSSSSEDSDSD